MEKFNAFLHTLWLFLTFRCNVGKIPTDEDILSILSCIDVCDDIICLHTIGKKVTPKEERNFALNSLRHELSKFGIKTPALTSSFYKVYKETEKNFNRQDKKS